MATAPVPEASREASWRDAWVGALDAVELDVDATERLIEKLNHDDAEIDDLPLRGRDWVVPRLPVPLPAELADRARLLAQRQLDVSERLAHALVQTRAQLRAMTKLDRPEPPPVFVDQAM
ncbi:hypothetical protein [Kineococcus sp. GCM10028916]|uniref:hypothetical protein n=1 Tax=Kineococcus sp. GCM10028916 TaxID=3273394 RepID=UPI0036D247EF